MPQLQDREPESQKIGENMKGKRWTMGGRKAKGGQHLWSLVLQDALFQHQKSSIQEARCINDLGGRPNVDKVPPTVSKDTSQIQNFKNIVEI